MSVYSLSIIKELKESTEKSSTIANKLSRRIFWLNIILAIATAIGAFAAIWMAFIN